MMFMLHEMAKRTGLSILQLVTAINETGIKGEMRQGTRYWTLADLKALQAHIQGLKVR